MENLSKALILAFSMMMFVIGFTYSMYLINHLTATSEILLDTITTKNYYDNLKIDETITNNATKDSREVTVDAIVSTLYRYYKENYAVRIYDGDELIQVFDVNLETKIARAAAFTKNTSYATDPAKKASEQEMISLKKSIFNDKTKKVYLFEAPWTGSTDENTRARIDFFLRGSKGYINNTYVDYEKMFKEKSKIGFLEMYEGKTFLESFVEYAYTGETISTEDGLETITGSTQESSKIIITYRLKE